MVRAYLKILILVIPLVTIAGCSKVWHKATVDYQKYDMGEPVNVDHPIQAIIEPYKNQLDEKMNVVIGYNEVPLVKERVESNMGNWFADILLEESSRLITERVDFALQNYGGMRLPNIGAGPITIRTIYELMPFDNTLVIVEADGNVTRKLLDRIAEYGGWPISNTVSFQIVNGKAENILINGKELDDSMTYRIALPDYIANGGDGTDYLIDLPRQEFALLIRDLLINHIKRDTEAGVNQFAEKEGRISIVNQ